MTSSVVEGNGAPKAGAGRFIRLALRALETAAWMAAMLLFIWFDETDLQAGIGAVLVICALYFILLSIAGRPRAAAGLTALLVAVAVVVSRAKVHYLDAPLVFPDLLFLTGHSLWATLGEYRGPALVGGLGILAVAATFAAGVVHGNRDERRISPALRIASLIYAGMLASLIPNIVWHTFIWNPHAEPDYGTISNLAKSTVTLSRHGAGWISFSEVGSSGLAGGPPAVGAFAASDTALRAPPPVRPDILMVQEESVFDPRILGLPVQPAIAAYFDPGARDGIGGPLKVGIHGGGSWVTEFAAMTGLDPASFGDQALYLPVTMAGRLRHSLMTHLRKIGYETLVIYSADGRFMNAEASYRGLGAGLFDGFDRQKSTGSLFGQRDRDLYRRALAHMDRIRRSTGKPVFVFVTTTYNHGPHGGRTPPEGARAQAWLDTAVSGDHAAAYRDYYLRLEASVGDYRWLRDELRRRAAAKPVVLARFGDHQPQFTKDLVKNDSEDRLHRTWFAIEGFAGGENGTALRPVPDWGGGPLDVSYLPGVVLAAAGLDPDVLFAARLELMRRCRGRYADCDDPLKGRIHRTLIDRGLIDVDEILPQGGDRQAS